MNSLSGSLHDRQIPMVSNYRKQNDTSVCLVRITCEKVENCNLLI